jgi:hypothetical protein
VPLPKETCLSQKIVLQIIKQKYSPPGRDPYFVAELSLFDVNGAEFIPSPIRFADFQAAAEVVRREAAATYEEIQKAKVSYESGGTVKIPANFDEDQIHNLGFSSPESESPAKR